MADDRPADDDLAAVVAELRRKLEDLEGTALARASRLPTGSIEPTLLTAAKTDTLLLQGQTVNRADYPVLWQWIADSNLSPSVFGAGNGSTTFVLPDYRGRSMVGATAARPVGTLFGATERVILPANMATHTHQVNIRDHMSGSAQTPAEVGSQTAFHGHGSHAHGSHGHEAAIPRSDGGSTDVGPRITFGAAVGGSGVPNDSPQHQHFLYIPPHAVSEVAVGQNTPFNIESPAFSGNWLIYT